MIRICRRFAGRPNDRLFVSSAAHRRGTLRRCAVGVLLAVSAVAATVGLSGCGTTSERQATEQLLISDAVDRAVARIDLAALRGQKVYFDTKYIQHIKGAGFVNAEYVISAIRQQLTASECLLQDSPETADVVVEARVGAMGTDSHEVLYGVPATNATTVASSFVPTLPTLPPIPEIAVLKRHGQLGVAKLALFAYDRETGAAVWLSGISQGRSTAKDTWVFGAGPFQSGSIYRDQVLFAGSRVPWISHKKGIVVDEPTPAPYFGEHIFMTESDGRRAPDGESLPNGEPPELPQRQADVPVLPEISVPPAPPATNEP